MRPFLLFILMAFTGSSAISQHFYQDIIVTREIAQKRALYVQQKIRTVRIQSLDATGQPIDGFSSEQAITENYSVITTTTEAPLTGKTQNIAVFNAAGQLTQTTDTTDGNKTVISYYYLPNGKLSRIISNSSSPGGFSSKEEHIWTFNNELPVKMLKIKNSTDTTIISFLADDQGNAGEEKSIRNGKEQPTIYYYYNPARLLTDVVRYNARAKRLLPDYIFEYDEKARVSTMLVTTEGSNDYQKWYYTYDEQGLKSKDACYSKSKVLIGQVNYEYNK